MIKMTKQRLLVSLLLAHIVTAALAFVPMPLRMTTRMTSSQTSTSTATDYEIVKVDLADGRDYPIYIGAGFSEEQGKVHETAFSFITTCVIFVQYCHPVHSTKKVNLTI